MSRSLILTLFLFLFYIDYVFALPVKISGTLPGATNRTLYLIYCSDRIIYHEDILASALIDSNSFFSIETDLAEIQLVKIVTGHYSAELYLSPGCDLQLISDTLIFDNHYKSFLENEYLNFTISGTDPGNLNLKIRQLNEVVNSFIMENFSGALRRLNKELLDSLRHKTDVIDLPGNEYYSVYREYKLAVVEMSVYGTNKSELFRRYFYRKQVYYSNPEYMDFFNQYFKGHLVAADQIVTDDDLFYTVNYLGSYKALNDSAGKDTLLRNEVLREIVLLKQLKEWYYNPDFNQDKVLDILSQVKMTSKFPEHVIAAGNIINDLVLFRRGSPLPWFNLPDLGGKMVSSAVLERKCTYLCFVNVESPSSRIELDSLYSFMGTFGDQANFVIISLDPDKEVFIKYMKDHPSKCLTLYNGIGFQLIFGYKLSTLPVFMLLDKNLEIVSYPSAKPSEKVEYQIGFLVNK